CQAEVGIRDFHVTGVQTCALPISLVRPLLSGFWTPRHLPPSKPHRVYCGKSWRGSGSGKIASDRSILKRLVANVEDWTFHTLLRSEERRVGSGRMDR